MQCNTSIGPGAAIGTSRGRCGYQRQSQTNHASRNGAKKRMYRRYCSQNVITDFNSVENRNTFRDRLSSRMRWPVAVILYQPTSAEILVREPNCHIAYTSQLNDILAVSPLIQLTVTSLAKPHKFEFTSKAVESCHGVQSGNRLFNSFGRQIGSISMFLFGSSRHRGGEPVKYALTTSHNSYSSSPVHTAKRPVIGTVKRVFLDETCQKPLDGRDVDVILIKLLDDVDVHNTAIIDSRPVHLIGFANDGVDNVHDVVVKFRDDDDIGSSRVPTGVVSFIAVDVFDKQGRLDVGGPDAAYGVVSQNDDSEPFHFPGESGTLLIRKPTTHDCSFSDGSQAGVGVAILYARLEVDVIDVGRCGQIACRKRFISIAKPIHPIIERITADLEFADVTLFPNESKKSDGIGVLPTELLEQVLAKSISMMFLSALLPNSESASTAGVHSIRTILGVCSEWCDAVTSRRQICHWRHLLVNGFCRHPQRSPRMHARLS